MKIEKKIKAFTLTEILVVIVISSIVVGMALAVLNLVQTNFDHIRRNFQNTNELQQLEQQITIDFNRFHQITYDKNSGKIYLKNSLDSVVYEINNHLVIRAGDTLNRQIIGIACFFEGEEVGRGKLDALRLQFKEPYNFSLFVSKINGAKIYLTKNGN